MTVRGPIGRRKRAAVPIGSPVVQNLLDSIVDAVDSLPEVINVNGSAISANDDVIDLITASVGLDMAFRNDITIQQLISLVIASINNIPGVDVQRFAGVVNLTEGSASTTSVSANWTGPKRAVDRFSISCSHGDASPATIEDTSQSSYMASCVNLPVPGDMYNMTVYSIVDSCATSTSSSIDLVALPESVRLEESNMVNTTTITASWSKPNGIVDYYEVSCSNGTASPAQVNPSDALIASCTGLSSPGDNYTISVTSVSNGKLSVASTITITALPESVTLNEESNMVTSTTITASWKMPNGIADYYVVSCFDGTASPAKVDPSDDLIASCTGLPSPGDNYTISVTSVSNGKLSTASTITITALPESVTLSEESNMVTSTTITASWQMPNGIADYYVVSCLDGTASPAKVDSSDDLIASCTGLPSPGDNYTISVTSVSNGKLSAASTITITALTTPVTTPETTPETTKGSTPGTTPVPESVRLEESNMVNTTTITASWSKPNGIVDYYEVSCSNGTASPAQVNPSDALIASCTGLSSPGDNYTISVTSVSNGKLSVASTITITACKCILVHVHTTQN
eukprot:XP_011677166.1 PREDICTED: tenascin-R-like [Strongylocentrotus purpuratus]